MALERGTLGEPSARYVAGDASASHDLIPTGIEVFTKRITTVVGDKFLADMQSDLEPNYLEEYKDTFTNDSIRNAAAEAVKKC